MDLYTVRTSRGLRAYLALLHMLALVALQLADMPWPWQLGGGVMVVAGLVMSWPRQVEHRLRQTQLGQLTLWTEGEWQPVEILPDTIVTPWLTVLRLRLTGDRRKRTIIVLPDNMDRDEFRRLRVWLKWKGRGHEGHNDDLKKA